MSELKRKKLHEFALALKYHTVWWQLMCGNNRCTWWSTASNVNVHKVVALNTFSYNNRLIRESNTRRKKMILHSGVAVI